MSDVTITKSADGTLTLNWDGPDVTLVHRDVLQRSVDEVNATRTENARLRAVAQAVINAEDTYGYLSTFDSSELRAALGVVELEEPEAL